MIPMMRRNRSSGRRGSVLLMVLWMLIVLGIVGLSYSASVRTQLQVAQSVRDRAEAYWAARSGIEKAKAILSAADLSELTDLHPLFDDPETFADQPVGPGRFSLVVEPLVPGGEPRFGLVDEASRININRADAETLAELPGMTEEMADCLLDWRDQDEFPRPLGAEEAYYMTLEDPYPARNGNLTSVRELMRVRAWEPIFNAAYPDPYHKFLPAEKQPLKADPEESRALLRMLTAWSDDPGLAPDDDDKMELSDASASEIRRRIRGLSRSEADAIEAHRRDNQFNSPTDLLDVREVDQSRNRGSRNSGRESSTRTSTRGGRNSASRATVVTSSGGSDASRGNSVTRTSGGASSTQGNRRLFNLRRVGQIIDYFTTDESGETRPGKLNINTASLDALAALPGMTDDLASSIVNERDAYGAFGSPGEIANLRGMTEAAFRDIYPRVTTTSHRFGVTSRGISGRTWATIEAVLSVDRGEVEVVYWREY